MGPLGGRGRGRDRAVLLKQGTPEVGPSSPNTPDSHLPRWWGEKWVRMGKMGFLRHLGPPGGRGRGRDRSALLEQGTLGLGPSSPDTPDSHLPRWWGEKWGKNWGKMGQNGENGVFASFGAPGGRGRGRDRTALLGQGTQGVGPSSPDTPDSHLPRWFCEKWVRMGKMGFLRHLGAPGGGGRGRGTSPFWDRVPRVMGHLLPRAQHAHSSAPLGEKWLARGTCPKKLPIFGWGP